MGRTVAMKFIGKVKTDAKVDEVNRDGNTLLIKIKAPACEGKANKAIVKLLADYFHIPQSAVNIKSGLGNKNKVIEIEDLDQTG